MTKPTQAEVEQPFVKRAHVEGWLVSAPTGLPPARVTFILLCEAYLALLDENEKLKEEMSLLKAYMY